MSHEFRWALRGLRSNWRASLLSVCLLATALAANALVFSVVDSLYFNTLPYPDSDRIVNFRNVKQPDGPPVVPRGVTAALLSRQDLFEGVVAYSTSTVFLTGAGAAEQVRTINVTPGLLATLGVKPAWGQDLTSADVQRDDVDAVLISESLARSRFGNPAGAVGQQLSTSDVPLTIVGVMPASFRFTEGGFRIWRGINLDGPLGGRQTFFVLARLRPSVPIEHANVTLAQSSAFSAGWVPETMPFGARSSDPTRLIALLGAALCLWLTACANVATIQLALASARARTFAIQRALGASSGSLVRSSLFECALIVGLATAAGLILVWLAVPALVAALPPSYALGPLDPIDFDWRVVVFVGLSAIVTWSLASLPALFVASRARLLDLLGATARTQTASRRAQVARQLLTSAQISMAVVLLIGCLLFTQTYLSRIGVDKGFDAANLVQVTVVFPPQSINRSAETRQAVLDRLEAHPAVDRTFVGSLPSSGNTPSQVKNVYVDDSAITTGGESIREQRVRARYHEFFKTPLLQGRYFSDEEPATNAIVSEPFARRFLPGRAIGRTIRLDDGSPLVVVGVVAHARGGEERALRRQTSVVFTPLVVQSAAPRTAAPSPDSGRRQAGGPVSGFITVNARLNSMAALPDVLASLRREIPGFEVTAQSVEDLYRSWEWESLLYSQVMVAFGGVAFLVALAGIYGLIALMVQHRTRELGIRMALGASHHRIVRLVLGSSLRTTLAGLAAGAMASLWLATLVRSMLGETSSARIYVYLMVGLSVVTASLLATWLPARRASRIDPAITLRAE